MFLILMLMVVGLIVMSSMGQRRDRKKREAMISAIKKHDRVQTIGGVIGSVVEIKPEYVVLKVDESSNTRITFSRSAIAQVLTSAPESAGTGKEQA
jgi:preprotein translocase subunit YajC